MELFLNSEINAIGKKVLSKLNVYYKSEYKMYADDYKMAQKRIFDKLAQSITQSIMTYAKVVGTLPTDKFMYILVSNLTKQLDGDAYRDLSSTYSLSDKNFYRSQDVLHVVMPKFYDKGVTFNSLVSDVRQYIQTSGIDELQLDARVVAERLWSLRFCCQFIDVPIDIAHLFIRHNVMVDIGSELGALVGSRKFMITLASQPDEDLQRLGDYLQSNNRVAEDLLGIALKYI